MLETHVGHTTRGLNSTILYGAVHVPVKHLGAVLWGLPLVWRIGVVYDRAAHREGVHSENGNRCIVRIEPELTIVSMLAFYAILTISTG
jgi:hypothetical protein